MKRNCQLLDGKCSQCGVSMSSPTIRECSAHPSYQPPTNVGTSTPNPAPLKQCKYFLGSARTSVKVFNCGCPAQRVNGTEVAVSECEIHDYCITFPYGDLPPNTTIEGSPVARCPCSDYAETTDADLP